MKYTILHINDRAVDLINKNKKILKPFEYIDSIDFFNGNTNNSFDELASRGIDVSSWSPYDGRTFAPLPGELGVWISYLNVFKYIVDTNTESMLAIEDDAILKEDAALKINDLLTELPKDWDFLSLHYNFGQNQMTEETDIGSSKIHKSINQFASSVAVIYSYACAKKILELVEEKGLEYTVDCFLYRHSILGLINGYSIIPGDDEIVSHDDLLITSTIDPENLRNPIIVESEMP